MPPEDSIAPPTPAPGAAPPRPVRRSALIAALVAGLAAWLGGEAAYAWFVPVITYTPEYAKMADYEKADFRSAQLRRSRDAAETRNTAVAYGGLAAALAAALGLVGGLSRRSAAAGLFAAVVGAVAGAAALYGVSALVVPLFYEYEDPNTGLLVPAATHLALFAAVGAAGGLALGLGRGGRASAVLGLLGGLVGGVIGTFAYEAAIAAAFPLLRISEPIPSEWLPRLLAHLCVAVASAGFAALSLPTPRPKSTASPDPVA